MGFINGLFIGTFFNAHPVCFSYAVSKQFAVVNIVYSGGVVSW